MAKMRVVELVTVGLALTIIPPTMLLFSFLRDIDVFFAVAGAGMFALGLYLLLSAIEA